MSRRSEPDELISAPIPEVSALIRSPCRRVAHQVRIDAQHEDGKGSLGCPQFVARVDRESCSGHALTGAFEAISFVTGGEFNISRLVFTRFVLMSANTKMMDANKHMTAN